MTASSVYGCRAPAPRPFSIQPSRCAVLTDPTLRAEILAHTRSEEEATSILRSIGRFGDDPSVRYYELTPVTGRSRYHVASASWTVSAVR